jgi:hypothetical protein
MRTLRRDPPSAAGAQDEAGETAEPATAEG